jgi:hypothetical protein
MTVEVKKTWKLITKTKTQKGLRKIAGSKWDTGLLNYNNGKLSGSFQRGGNYEAYL